MSTTDEQKSRLHQKILTYPLIEHPLMPTPDEEQRRQMIENVGAEEVMRLFLMREQRVRAEQSDPHRYGNELASWPDADKLLNTHSELLVLGGNRCLAGETMIFDPVAQVSRRVDQITEPFHVEAWDFDLKQKVSARASKPFQKPVDDLYRAVLSNGEQIECSAAHRVSTPFGWSSLKDIGLGGLVASHQATETWISSCLDFLLTSLFCLLPSTVGTFLLKMREDVLHWSQTAQDCLSGCPSSLRFYDAQLLLALKADQCELPLQADAQEHTDYAFVDEDGRARKPQCTRPYFDFAHRAILCAGSRFLVRFFGTVFRTPCTSLTDRQSSIQSHALSEQRPKSVAAYLCEGLLQIARIWILAFLRVASWALTKHNELRLVNVYHKRRDVVWDISVERYVNYFIGSILHKNSGKTEYAAKRIAQAFVGADLNGFAPDWIKDKFKKRGLNIWCLHTTNMTSVSMQQNVFQKYLPPELKEAKRSKSTQVSWTQKNGFSDNTAVYNGNQIWFLNYSQDIKVVEGGEVDFVWCDELVPADWLETLKYRLITRNGKLLVTFTPILGYTQTVKEFISTSRIKTWKESELLPHSNVIGVPKGHMPYTAEGVYGKHACIWFHSKLNPYNNWERMQQTLKGRSTHDIKIRAYGWAEQTAGSQFPMFGDKNIFTDSVTDHCPEGTNYMVADPAGARNWFMLWARVDAHGTVWVYREWPDQSYGEWALPSDKADGRPGPAQRSGGGRGINEYTELVWSLETHDDKREEIAERYIDPRSAGTETTSKEGGVTLLDLLLDASEPLYFQPAASVSVDERVLIVNDLLCYDRDADIDSEKNHPRLMVHESCQNLIYSLREWTGHDGQKGACKDPIDALGYLVVMQPSHTGALNNSWQKFNKCGSY